MPVSLRMQESTLHLGFAARVIDSIGEESLWHALAQLVEQLVDRRPPVIYLFAGSRTPQVMFHPFAPEDVEVQISKYLAGPYLLDPFYTACRGGVSSGAYRLAYLAPDHFQQSRYFKEFYEDAGIVDEFCLISKAPGHEAYVVMSIARFRNERPFGRSELAVMRNFDGFIQAILRKHWMQAAVEDSERSLALRAMEEFGYPTLTHREREIATLILRGHSSKSAGNALNISAETVRNHRKKLYAKLGVGSQSQLFSLFINHAFGKSAV